MKSAVCPSPRGHRIRPAIPDLREIVARLGGDLSAGGRQASIPGPGHSKHDRSLSLRVSDEGDRILFNSFAGDSPRVVFAYLGIDNASEYKPTRQEIAAARRRRESEARRAEAEKLAFCASVWSGSMPLEGSPAARYLWNRGLVLDGCSDVRFHPAVDRKAPWNVMAGDPPPPAPHYAMVCLARDGHGAPRGLHATYLTEDGRKAFGDRSRLMFGPMAGAALRTAPVAADGTLAVAEGLETAGSYSLLRSVPTWAAFSTAGIEGFQPPLSVSRLLIAADNDENGAGLRAAEKLAKRLQGRCAVEIEVPARVGDWNQVLMEGADG
jgi:putative DNA primase/helicase